MFPTPLVNFDTHNNDPGGWNKMAITFIFVDLTFNCAVADLFITDFYSVYAVEYITLYC